MTYGRKSALDRYLSAIFEEIQINMDFPENRDCAIFQTYRKTKYAKIQLKINEQ